jgi:phosphonate transport system permease protein
MARMIFDAKAVRERHPHHFGAPSRDQRLLIAAGAGALMLLIVAMAQLGFFGSKFIEGVGKLGDIVGLMLPPNPGEWAHVRLYLMSLVETIAIALLGTLGASVIALPLALLAARNVIAARLLRFMTRRSLDVIRSIDILIWALIWINVVGLGPFAGVLAIMTSDTGNFGKLFSEAIEAVDRKPREGIVAGGSSWPVAMRFGALPQTLSNFVSYSLLRFEINVREAAVMGFVGAGGIGMDLIEAIRKFYYSDVSAILLLIVITVGIIDTLTGMVRHRLIGLQERY